MNVDLLKAFFEVSESSPSGLIWIQDNIDANGRINNESGEVAGNLQLSGYWKVALKDNDYYVHRIIYTLVNGLIDDGLVVDHINKIKSDNRLSNLRLLSHGENIRRGDYKPGKTGVRGVYYTNNGNIVSAWVIKGVRGWSESFDVSKLGLAEAIRRAEAVRNAAIKEGTKI